MWFRLHALIYISAAVQMKAESLSQMNAETTIEFKLL